MYRGDKRGQGEEDSKEEDGYKRRRFDDVEALSSMMHDATIDSTSPRETTVSLAMRKAFLCEHQGADIYMTDNNEKVKVVYGDRTSFWIFINNRYEENRSGKATEENTNYVLKQKAECGE